MSRQRERKTEERGVLIEERVVCSESLWQERKMELYWILALQSIKMTQVS
jgi:hypothetical protein